MAQSAPCRMLYYQKLDYIDCLIGCFWHACLKCYPLPHGFNTIRMCTHQELRNQTKAIDDRIREYASEYRIMYECEWDAMKREDKSIARMLKEIEFVPRMEPREALFGGRVEVFRLLTFAEQEGDDIRHDDFQSLYPDQCLKGKYGKGHPEVRFGPFGSTDLAEYFGICHLTILPSRDCYTPPLPLRTRAKNIVYTLCRMCAEEFNMSTPCAHSEDERAITGVWDCEEITMAVRQCGYQILRIFELHHFPETLQWNRETGTHGIFSEYIIRMSKGKIANSGFPRNCVTDEEKRRYCEGWRREIGIDLLPEEVIFNAGRRFCFKVSRLIYPWHMTRKSYVLHSFLFFFVDFVKPNLGE